jgi:hypothetical protein|tara:strand:+ start:244 stop:789 length:546 start_codon:yes stop_codon:yes gene_type:complete
MQEPTLREMGRQTITRKEKCDYELVRKQHIFTTRFNNATWEENIKFRTDNNVKCAYFAPNPIPKRVQEGSILFVLEMNNETNQLMGLGLLKNKPHVCKYTAYKDNHYNRITYLGSHHIQREQIITKSDEMRQIWEDLEYFCFKGKGHLKRGRGMTSFPVATLLNCNTKINITNILIELFQK